MALNIVQIQTAAVDARPSVPHTLYSTGVDNDGAPLAPSSVDPHWTLTDSADPSYPGPDVIVTNPQPSEGWMATGGYVSVSAPLADSHPAGDYTYQQTFTLPSDIDAGTARIVGRISTDYSGVVLLNGVEVFSCSYTSWAPVDFTIDSGFVNGSNVIEVVVTNDTGPTGVIVLIDSLTARPPVVVGIPTNLDLVVTLADSQSYYITATWTAPERVNLVAWYELEVRTFTDAAATDPIGDWKTWTNPPASETQAVSSQPYWLRNPDIDVYIRYRIRVAGIDGARTAWAESPVRLIEKQVPPGVQTALVLTVDLVDALHFELDAAWTPPTNLLEIKWYEAEAQYYNKTTLDPISNWILLGYPSRYEDVGGSWVPNDDETFYGKDKPWDRPAIDADDVKVRVRMRTINSSDVPGTWVYSDYELLEKAVSAAAGTPCVVCWQIDGTLATGTNLGKKIPLAVPAWATVAMVEAAAILDTAPTGADVIFDLNLEGTSIFGTTKLVVAAASTANVAVFQATFASPAPEGSRGDLLTLDIDQIGSTIAGADAKVILRMQYS